PRREAPRRVALNQDNSKRFNSSDFRANRIAAEQLKRAQDSQRDLAAENRIRLREPERVQSMRAQPSRQNDVRSEQRARPPVQALQGGSSENRSNHSGDNSLRRRESFESRDTFQRGDTRREEREIRENHQFRERASESRREVREAPVERRSAPQIERRSAPQIERRSAPQVEHRPAPRVEQQRPEPRVQRSEPRVERQHSDRGNSNSNQGSSRRDSGGEGPRGDRPNRRPD
ncbi:MAG TPA: hypothetical protein VFO35_15320, partial [Steroidobacteraceae bacterium]|nr:hypothetical protein [Steroidobacteraceae bacterium]